MLLVRNPWVWICRFRKRRGYGVHSPFAFTFLSDVAFERTPFYAFKELSLLHPWWVRWFGLYPLTCRRMLFRLANYAVPKTMRVINNRPIETAYLSHAVPSAQWVDGAADFVFLPREQGSDADALLDQMPANGVMVIEGIHADHSSLQQWHRLQTDAHTGVTFDFYTYGIIFFDPSLQKQHYLVNF